MAGAATAGVFLLVASINFFALMRTPAPFVDEGWLASRAWALAKTGIAFSSMDIVLARFEGYATYFPWLGTFFHALSMQLLGPNLFAVRLVSFVFGLVVLASIYSIAASLYGRRTALIAVVLAGISTSFLYWSHLARHDVIVAAFGFAALALYVADSASSFSLKAVLCGLLAGLAVEIHLNGMIYGPVLLALFASDYGKTLLKAKRFWGFALGGALGLSFFAAMHLLGDPETYAALVNIEYDRSRTPPLLSLDAGLLLQSARESIDAIGWRFVLALAGVVVLLRRGGQADRKLLVMFAGLFVAFTAIIRLKQPVYAILLTPGADLVIAAMLAKLSVEPLSRSVWVYGRTILIGGILAASMLVPLMAATKDPTGDFETTLDQLREVIPAGATVMGAETYWFGLPHHDYYAWGQLVRYQRAVPGASLQDAFNALRPDFFIADGWVDQFMTDEPAKLDPASNVIFLSRAELDRILTTQGRMVATIKTNTFGGVRVYEIDWPPPEP